MDEISEIRQLRRKTYEGQFHLTIADRVNEELVEDILYSAPQANSLQFDVFDEIVFDTSLLSRIPDIEFLRIKEGSNLGSVDLRGLAEMRYLLQFELNIYPEKPIRSIDLTPLRNHEEIKVITVACPTEELKLEGLNTCPKLESIGIYSIDTIDLDLSPLSGARNLRSIYIGDFGRDISEAQTVKITLPTKIPLRVLRITESINSNTVPDVDFSFTHDIEAMDEISLRNCNLHFFELERIAPLERIGSIDLRDNPLTHLDITSLLEVPMFTNKALGEQPFAIDDHVTIQIDSTKKEEIERILALPDLIIDHHDGEFAIEYEFGHQWLAELISSHSIEWI